MKKTIHQFIQLFLLIMIALVTLTGCNARLFSYKGALITQENHMIRLQEGEQQGIWKTNELSLDYRYLMASETLNLSGTVTLVGGYALGFNLIDRLVVQLLFLDNNGTVIDNINVYSAENRRSIDMTPMNFEKTIPIFPGTQAISFAYDGRLIDGDSDPTSVDIWDFPS